MSRQKVIWEYYQTEDTKSFAGCRPRIESVLARIPRGRVLNIGVGDAAFETLALKKGLDAYALDPGEATIERLRNRLGLGEKAVVGCAENLPFADGFFDFVAATEVIEHLDAKQFAAALREIRRVLVPHGVFLGTTPADEDLRRQLVVCPACGCRFHRWGHRQSFSAAGLAAALREVFAEADVRRRLFVAWDELNGMGRIAAALKLFLFRLGRRCGGESLVFEARRD